GAGVLRVPSPVRPRIRAELTRSPRVGGVGRVTRPDDTSTPLTGPGATIGAGAGGDADFLALERALGRALAFAGSAGAVLAAAAAFSPLSVAAPPLGAAAALPPGAAWPEP